MTVIEVDFLNLYNGEQFTEEFMSSEEFGGALDDEKYIHCVILSIKQKEKEMKINE